MVIIDVGVMFCMCSIDCIIVWYMLVQFMYVGVQFIICVEYIVQVCLQVVQVFMYVCRMDMFIIVMLGIDFMFFDIVFIIIEFIVYCFFC